MLRQSGAGSVQNHDERRQHIAVTDKEVTPIMDIAHVHDEVSRNNMCVVGPNRAKISSQAIPIVQSYVIMATNPVSQKMKAFQARQKNAQEQITLEQVDKMTLEELSQETVQFGTAKKGMKFEQAFADHSWAEWFVNHYEKRAKPQHRKFIRYVELVLDTDVPPQPNNQAKKTQGYLNVEKQKKGPSSHAESSTSVWEQVKPVGGTESESETDSNLKFSHLEEEVVFMRAETRQLNTRMMHMESAMQEMVQHLRQMSVKAEN